MRIRNPGWKKFGPGWKKFGIRDPGKTSRQLWLIQYITGTYLDTFSHQLFFCAAGERADLCGSFAERRRDGAPAAASQVLLQTTAPTQPDIQVQATHQSFKFNTPFFYYQHLFAPYYSAYLHSFVMSKEIVPKYRYPEKWIVSLCNKKIYKMARKSLFLKDVFYSCSSKANYFAPSFMESLLSYTSLVILVKHRLYLRVKLFFRKYFFTTFTTPNIIWNWIVAYKFCLSSGWSEDPVFFFFF